MLIGSRGRSDSAPTWVTGFLLEPRNKYLVTVDEEFLCNSFNIAGMKPKIAHFNAAYDVLRRSILPDADREAVPLEARALYGMLHQRFILTRPGMQLMFEKWQQGDFPKCPRVNCHGAQGLPYGLTEEWGRQSVKMFCPGCSDVYNIDDPDVRDLDGAFFGPSWTHMFLQKWQQVIPPGPRKVYVPKIFGFRIAHAGMGDRSASGSDE
jgi:casein kinase II subunit beta